jgi:hypothetical protein
MNKVSKLVISIIGICAVVVPALLLIFFTSKNQVEPQTTSDKRTIDAKSIEDSVKKNEMQQVISASPVPVATSSAQTKESSPSSQ